MHVEIDQSGKIGNSQQDVVVACAGSSFRYTVRIPASVQRAFLWELRGQVTKTTYTRLFALCLYFLLRDHIAQIDTAYIDVEYPGQDDQIRRYLLNYLWRDGIKIDKRQIVFAFVGKKSPAHSLGLETFRGNLAADLVLDLETILARF